MYTESILYFYDAWGNQKIKYLNNEGEMVALREDYEYNNTDEINAFIAVKNPFRYRSYYYDFETNLYYLNSRYYDPQIGRFINADNISNVDKSTFNGLNLYAYCVNNPVMLTDSQGESWWSDFWKGVKNFFKKVGDVLLGILSVGLVIGGVLLTVFSGGALLSLGGAMIGAGIGSFIGGANSKFNGGSYWAGWIGGAISGGLSGLGASLGIFGLGWSFGLATLGNAVGTAITDNLNGVNQDSADYWARLFVDSSLSGLFSIISLKFGNAIGVFNIPGFRNIYAGITVLAEFGFSFMTDRTVSLLEKIADFLKPIFGF